MPEITLAWSSTGFADHAATIAGELARLANAYNLAIHVTAKGQDEEGTESVSIKDVQLPPEVIARLRALADSLELVIHVQDGTGMG